MSCSGCQLLVTEALEELKGVTHADASYLDGIVTVDYEPGLVTIAAIKEVIEQQGFKTEE